MYKYIYNITHSEIQDLLARKKKMQISLNHTAIMSQNIETASKLISFWYSLDQFSTLLQLHQYVIRYVKNIELTRIRFDIMISKSRHDFHPSCSMKCDSKII